MVLRPLSQDLVIEGRIPALGSPGRGETVVKVGQWVAKVGTQTAWKRRWELGDAGRRLVGLEVGELVERQLGHSRSCPLLKNFVLELLNIHSQDTMVMMMSLHSKVHRRHADNSGEGCCHRVTKRYKNLEYNRLPSSASVLVTHNWRKILVLG